MVQLLLFEEPAEEKLERELQDLKIKIEVLRKGQYAKITTLQGQVNSLIEQVKFLESHIVKNGMFLV